MHRPAQPAAVQPQRLGAPSRRLARRAQRRPASRRGLSLLEVMLAIAILGGALVAIGELIRTGSRSAAAARELTTAQLHCESKLAEVAAGIVPPESIGPIPLETDSDWRYTIESAPANQPNLLVVRVTVEQELPPTARPLSFSLTRWMIDPASVASPTPSETSPTDGGAASGGAAASGS